jgi:hypothetical protein
MALLSIGSKTFNSKKSAKQYFRDMLARYADGERIESEQDHADLEALVRRLDDALIANGEPEKRWEEIAWFERRINYPHKTSGFWLVRHDGSQSDFSFIFGVDCKSQSIEQSLVNACRAAIKPDIDKFRASKRDAHGLFLCDLDQTVISARDAHVDHAKPFFSTIVAQFRLNKGWQTIPVDIFTAPGDSQTETRFSDKQLEDEFKQFHRSIARLRIIKAKTNLQLSNRIDR